MTTLSWNGVEDRNERLEFGASHVNEAWRRHRTPQSKFLGLESALRSSDHRLPVLLQQVGGNYNARNHRERGQALFAAVWYATTPWAILCSPLEATLVWRKELEAIPVTKGRDDQITGRVQAIFDASDAALRVPLDDSLYQRVIRSR